MFISFEGIDGSGKSTQARMLASALRGEGHEVVQTREPGGSAGGEEIRKLLVEGGTDRWSAETEMMLFTAARRDHLERVITPALTSGSVVITDRFADSTRVYQGLRGKDLRAQVDALHDLMIRVEPDVTFVIDLDPAMGLARGAARGTGEDRFEMMGLDFQTRLRAGFVSLSRAFPDRVKLIDGTGAPEDVAALVRATLSDGP